MIDILLELNFIKKRFFSFAALQYAKCVRGCLCEYSERKRYVRAVRTYCVLCILQSRMTKKDPIGEKISWKDTMTVQQTDRPPLLLIAIDNQLQQ